MKSFLLIFFLLGIFAQLLAQPTDRLITGNDTLKCQIKVVEKHDDLVVSYKKINDAAWNIIYPENADAAYVKDKELYFSLKLPDSSEKVWVRCFFDGAYQLLEYHNQLYILEGDNFTLLKPIKDKENVAGKSNAKIFIGQMILIFADKVDYNFNTLEYDSKSIALPLIKYHSEKQIQFKDFNNYNAPVWNYNISAGIASENYDLDVYTENMSGQLIVPLKMQGYAPFLNLSFNLSFPKLPKRLFFSGGVELVNNKSNSVISLPYSGGTNYYELNYNGVRIGLPLLTGLNIYSKNKFSVSAETGIKPIINLYSNTSLRLENESNNTIYTQFVEIENPNGIGFYHYSDLKINFPVSNKMFNVGMAYEYYFFGTQDVMDVLSIGNSMKFFIGYNF